MRVETHRLYSEAPGTFVAWLLDILDPTAGERVLDAGCGPGMYHSALASRGVAIAAVDLFAGMARDAHSTAARQGYAVNVAQASVERLPFAGGVFDRAMCNHMLYHVPDQRAALEELRRVLRPGGRVVISTNGADNMAALDALHRQACADVGLEPLVEMEPLRFTFEAPSAALVRSVFPGAQVRMREDALVFRDVDAVLRYYATFGVDQVVAPRPEGYQEPLLARMRELVGDTIARDDVFRVPKIAGCYVARNPA